MMVNVQLLGYLAKYSPTQKETFDWKWNRKQPSAGFWKK